MRALTPKTPAVGLVLVRVPPVPRNCWTREFWPEEPFRSTVPLLSVMVELIWPP